MNIKKVIENRKYLIVASSVIFFILLGVSAFYYVISIKEGMRDKVSSVAYKISGLSDEAKFKKEFMFELGINSSLQAVMSNVKLPFKVRHDRQPLLVTVDKIILKDSDIVDFSIDIKGVSIKRDTLRDALYSKEYETLDIIIEANAKKETVKMDFSILNECYDGICKAKLTSSIPGVSDALISIQVSKANKLMTILSSSEFLKSYMGMSRDKMLNENIRMLNYLISNKKKDTKDFKEAFIDSKYAQNVINLYDAFFIKGDTQLTIQVDDNGLKESIIKGFRMSQNVPNRFIKVINKIEKGSMSFGVKARHSLENSSFGFSLITPFAQMESSVSAETDGHVELANILTSQRLSKSARFAGFLSKTKDISVGLSIADDKALESVNKEFVSGVIGKYITGDIVKDSASIKVLQAGEFKRTPSLLSIKAKLEEGDLETNISVKSPLINGKINKTFGFNTRKLNNGVTPYGSLDFKSFTAEVTMLKIKDLFSSLIFNKVSDVNKANAMIDNKILKDLRILKESWVAGTYESEGISQDFINAILASTRTDTLDDLFDKLEEFVINPSGIKVEIKLDNPMGLSYIVEADKQDLIDIVTEMTPDELHIEL